MKRIVRVTGHRWVLGHLDFRQNDGRIGKRGEEGTIGGVVILAYITGSKSHSEVRTSRTSYSSVTKNRPSVSRI